MLDVWWDVGCMGVNGQIDRRLAKRLRAKGLATIDKSKQVTVKYGNGTKATMSGICRLTVSVSDGEDSAEFALQLRVLDSDEETIIIGWNTIGPNKISLVEDEENVVIPTSRKRLRIPKLTFRKWLAVKRNHVQIAQVNAIIPAEFRNKESIFGCSPSSSTNPLKRRLGMRR